MAASTTSVRPEDVIRRIGDTNERALAYVLEPDPQLNRLSRKVREAIITDLPPVTAGALLGPAALARHFIASAASGRYRDLFPLWQLFRLRPDDCRPVLAERQKALEKGRLALATAVRLGLSGHAERVAEDITRAEGLIWQWLRAALLAELPAVGQRPMIASALLLREPGAAVPLPAEPDDRWLAEAAAAREDGPLAPPVEALLAANAHRLPATIATLSLAWEHYPERVAELVSRIDLSSPSIGALLAWARDHALGDRVAARITEDVQRAAVQGRAEGVAAWFAWRQRGVDVELPAALRAHDLDGLDVSRPDTAALAAVLVADGAPLDMQGTVDELATRNRQLAEKAYEAFVCAGLDVTLPAALENNPLVKEGTRCPYCQSWTYVRAGHERRCPRRPEPGAAPAAPGVQPEAAAADAGGAKDAAPAETPTADAWDMALAEAESADAAAAPPAAPADTAATASSEAGPPPAPAADPLGNGASHQAVLTTADPGDSALPLDRDQPLPGAMPETPDETPGQPPALEDPPTAADLPAAPEDSPTAAELSAAPEDSPIAADVLAGPEDSPTAADLPAVPEDSPTAADLPAVPEDSPTAADVLAAPGGESPVVPPTSAETGPPAPEGGDGAGQGGPLTGPGHDGPGPVFFEGERESDERGAGDPGEA